MSIEMEIDFPPRADMRPVDEAASWVAFNRALDEEEHEFNKSPEEKALELKRDLEISALVWLAERYGTKEYDLDSMTDEIGEWREWSLDEETADSIQAFAAQAIKHDNHRPDQVETTVYLYMMEDC